MKLSPQHIQDLTYSKKLLEHPSLAARLTDTLTSPIEKGFAMLPHKWAEIIHVATRKSIEKTLKVAVKTMKSSNRSQQPSNRIHKAAVMTSGATGGAFGLVALPIELPISTVIMFRSISDIARSEGEDLNSPETMLNCLQIFALGWGEDQIKMTPLRRVIMPFELLFLKRFPMPCNISPIEVLQSKVLPC